MTASLADFVISSLTKQYVIVPISEVLTSGSPTADSVQMAFPLPGTEPATWISGDWTTVSGVYYARALVGVGTSMALTRGYYDVYVKITDSPEIPVLRSGLLEVT